jgi:hypothetical protein
MFKIFFSFDARRKPDLVENSKLHTAISLPRFSRYYIACNNNRRKALALYRANIILSEKLYAIIGMFEIILRNSIDRHFITKKGDHRLEEAVQPGGYLDVSDGCEDSFHVVQDAIQKLGPAYTHEALISKLTFGFWTYLFAKKQFVAGGSTLLEIFRNRPFAVKQKTVFQDLIKINEIRNRIAHYEPVCFLKGTDQTIAVVNCIY